MRLQDITPGENYVGIRNQRYTINKWPIVVLEQRLNERRQVPCARQDHRGEWHPVWLTLPQIFRMNDDYREQIDRTFNKRRLMEDTSRLLHEAEQNFIREMRIKYGITLHEEDINSSMGSHGVDISVVLTDREFVSILNRARQGMMFPNHQAASL